MAWVRIHDGALTHPKIVGLPDAAFRLWVWGLSYAQSHLTDGVIPTAALTGQTKRTARRLVASGLWIEELAHFRIHDYLQWNDSRSVVLERLHSAKERKTRWNQAKEAYKERVLNAPLERVRNDAITKPNQTIYRKAEAAAAPAAPAAASAAAAPLVPRPRTNGRLTLHRWQIEELLGRLGDYAQAFNLEAWLWNDLSARTRPVFATRDDQWQWVQEQFASEVARRQLPTPGKPGDPFARSADVLRQAEADLKARGR